MLIHSVYFWLKPDLSSLQRAEFQRGLESLARIKSVETLYLGTPAPTARESVVDYSFSFGLTVLFKDLASHNAYQDDPIHLAFVETCQKFWNRVQVYDAA